MPIRVVELFTSQGCSSCPVSNALLTDLSEDESVLGLTYSVEYWDYLGWKDTFANPVFSDRQRSYSNAIGHGRVYTPQMVINGVIDKPRFQRSDVMAQSLPQIRPLIDISDEGRVSISAQNEAKFDTATIHLITYMPGTQNVRVRRGENGGRVLNLTNVVTNIDVLGHYTGQAIAFNAGTLSDYKAYAVIMQSHDNGPILAATHYAP